MWRFRLIGFFIILLIMTTAATTASVDKASAAGTPKAVIETTSFTFAPVVEGTEVRHNFTIQNTGDGPLIIKEVKTG